jgi:WD40 repeat protein
MRASGDDGSFDVALPIDPFNSVALAVSPDGSRAVVLELAPGQEEAEPNVSVISLRSGQPPVVQTFPAPSDSLSLAMAPDGQTLALVASGGQEVIQIDAESGRQRGESVGVPDFAVALRYSPDSRTLFVADSTGAVSKLDVASGTLSAGPALSPTGQPVTRLALTPRGDRMMALTADGSIVFVDPMTARPVGSRIQIGSAELIGATVSRDGSQLAAVDSDGALHLWNLETRRALGPPLRTDSPAVADPVFLRDGRQIVTGSFDGFLSWDLDPDTWKASACALVARDLSRQEWTSYLPDEPYRGTCSDS